LEHYYYLSFYLIRGSVLNYIIKIKTQRKFPPSTKEISWGQVRSANIRVRTESGSGLEGCRPHEDRIGLELKKNLSIDYRDPT